MRSRREVLIASAGTASALCGCLSGVPASEEDEDDGGGGTNDSDGDDDWILAEGLDPTGAEAEATAAIAQFQQDAQNTGQSGDAPPASLSENWRLDTSLPPKALIASNESVYFLQNGLWAYDAVSGEAQWGNPFYVKSSSTPAVSGDTVYVPIGGAGAIKQDTAGIAAFDVSDGRLRWRTPENLHVGTPPTLHDGTVFACGFSDNAYALAVDAATGEEHWREPIEELAIEEPETFDTDAYWNDEGLDDIRHRLVAPAVSDGIVYVAAGRPPALIALDAEDGSEQWRVSLDALDEAPEDSEVGGAPSVHEEMVYIGTREGGLYAIDAGGEQQWAEPVENGITQSIAADASGLYVPASRATRNPGPQVTIKLDHDGSQQWSVDVGRFQQPPIITDQYLISGDDEMAVIRRKDDGEAVWTFEPESRAISDVVYSGRPEQMAVSGGTVYVATDSRYLVAFR